MEIYECKSCGTIIGTVEKKPLFCPLCRGKVVLIKEKVNLNKEISCPDCDEKFYVEEKFSPYKCCFCNYTFSVTPYRRAEERL
jgi:DNA-directed RNA polymerase subunit RPC12/RpoP